jgi:hypothetical protein
MGDRGNIVIVQHAFNKETKKSERRDIFLYSHNIGYKLPRMLQEVLARKSRWDDSSYLARMIFCRMVKGNVSGEIGYGISTYPTDNQCPYLIVDCKTQTVSASLEEKYPETFKSVSFQEFVDLTSEQVGLFRSGD